MRKKKEKNGGYVKLKLKKKYENYKANFQAEPRLMLTFPEFVIITKYEARRHE